MCIGSCCCKHRDAVWTKSVLGHDWIMLLSLARVALEFLSPSSPPPMACILSFSCSPPPSFFLAHLSSSFSQAVALHPLLLQHMKPRKGWWWWWGGAGFDSLMAQETFMYSTEQPESGGRVCVCEKYMKRRRKRRLHKAVLTIIT